MKFSIPVTRFSYKKDSLKRLGEILRDFFSRKPNILTNPSLDSGLLNSLDEECLHVLTVNGLVHLNKNRYFWGLLPVLSDGLLLFCDFPKFESDYSFVWLSTNFSGGSWKFSRTLPMKKGDRVLDLGTGTGLIALTARLKGGTAFGVDINPRAIKLAQLNRDLNGLNSVEFQKRSWNSMEGDQFDLIVSQPPFGFSLGSLGLAFNGGNFTGLQATKEIIDRFNPEHNQILGLFVHALEDDSHSRFLRLILFFFHLSRIVAISF